MWRKLFSRYEVILAKRLAIRDILVEFRVLLETFPNFAVFGFVNEFHYYRLTIDGGAPPISLNCEDVHFVI